ncbi:MAG: GntR family transcriptional regulator [Spirochaetaceae bacterium]|nr:GntR family transcriptional regulator [Spirochaetaceae bacterium]
MEFTQPQAIYLQIGDYLCDNILRRRWRGGDRIPSIRELAVDVQVNPNTVARTYAYLQDRGIIYNRRGTGYFVADRAYRQARELKRRSFVDRDLPQLFRTMDLLGLELSDLERHYRDRSRSTGEQEEAVT